MSDLSSHPLDQHWRELVTTALLGTDRRPPPTPPAGPFSALTLERSGRDQAAVLIEQVAAVTVARRAASRPDPALVPFEPPPADSRPECPAAAVAIYHEIVEVGPVLEDEWVLAVLLGGWRLARELVAPLLVRHRSDPVRRRRVELAAGPLAHWLEEHLAGEVPGLNPARHRSTARIADRDVIRLPELPMPPGLVHLLTAPDDAEVLLLAPLAAGEFGASHLNVLVHLIARWPPEHLPTLAGELEGLAESGPVVPNLLLAHLAGLRQRMLAILGAPSASDLHVEAP